MRVHFIRNFSVISGLVDPIFISIKTDRFFSGLRLIMRRDEFLSGLADTLYVMNTHVPLINSFPRRALTKGD